MKRKNQWRIYDIYSDKSKKFDIKAKRSLWRVNFYLRKILKGSLTIFISVLVIFTIVRAGSLTPSANPGSTMTSLSDIAGIGFSTATHSLKSLYNWLTANVEGTKDALTGTYDASGVNANASGNIMEQLEFIQQNLGGYTYGSSDANQVLTTANGTYDTTNLIPENVRSGVAFGIDNGSQVGTYGGGSWTYGSDQSEEVLTIADAAGTYDATNLSSSTVKSGVAFGVNETGAYPSADYPLPGDTIADDATAGDVLNGLEFWNKTGSLITGTMPIQTLSASNETVNAGYYAATTLSAVDTDLTNENIKYGTTIFGFLGSLSPYPNTPSGISGLNQTVCANAGWTWVADSNYDGVEDDPICVNPNREAGTKVWNTSVANDNTFIGNYGCSGDPDGDGIGTLDTTLSGTVVENTGYGDDANTALAIADCKDGIRNLLTKAEVESVGYTAPDTDCTPDADSCYNGPLTPKALIEWKGTRLPTHNDFFDVCGNGTNSTTYGNYGNQIGRTDNVITANAGSWEWLSESRNGNVARIAGNYACSYFNSNVVTSSYGVRAVFRP